MWSNGGFVRIIISRTTVRVVDGAGPSVLTHRESMVVSVYVAGGSSGLAGRSGSLNSGTEAKAFLE